MICNLKKPSVHNEEGYDNVIIFGHISIYLLR